MKIRSRLLGWLAVVGILSSAALAGVPYGAGNYGAGWYGYGAAELVLDSNSILIPEGTSTQLVLRLSMQPPRSQTVTVARVSGDANVGFVGVTNLLFTTNNWNQNQWVTMTASVDVAHLDGTAIVQCASLEIGSTNLTVLRSGLWGASDADADGLANVLEYVSGAGWLDPHSAGFETAISGAGTNLQVAFDRTAATGPDYTNKTRRYRIETRTNLVAGQWAAVPGQTNITGTGTYTYPLSSTTSRFYRVRVWLSTP